MIKPLSVRSAKVPAAPLPSPTPSASAVQVPLDTAQITSRPPRPLFADAARLGLMTHGAVIAGPLGQSLSAAAQDDLGKLLHEMDAAGLSFATDWNPDRPSQFGGATPRSVDDVKATILASKGDLSDAHLTVSQGKGMKSALIKHVAELEGLDALAVRKDAHGLSVGADLGQTLLALQDKGQHVVVDADNELNGRQVVRDFESGNAREVGPYGAWRAFTEPRPAPIQLGSEPVMVHVDNSEFSRVYMTTADLEPFSMSFAPETVPVCVPGEDAVQKMAFFELNSSHAELDKDTRATNIRELAKHGVTFHQAESERDRGFALSPLGFYDWVNGGNDGEFWMGVLQEGRIKVGYDEIDNPGKLPASFTDLMKFHDEHVRDRHANGTLNDRDARLWVRAVALPAGNLDVAQRGAVIEDFYAHEKALGTRPEVQAYNAAKTMTWFAKLLKKGDNAAPLAAELKELASRKLGPDSAGEAVAYFHGVLPQITFDRQDFEIQREEIVQLAALTPKFADALEAHELLAYTQPFADGMALLHHVIETDHGLKAPQPPSNPDDLSSLLKDEPSTFAQATADYKLVLAHKQGGESPLEAAAALRVVHSVLVPALGWEASRQAFVFLQRGAAHHAFGEHARDEAAGVLLQNFMMSQDLGSAIRATLALGRTVPQVITDADTGDVIVGGVRIPRNNSHANGGRLEPS